MDKSSASDETQRAVQSPAFSILAAISLSHLLNDLVQSVVPAVYPVLKNAFNLSLGQVGLITFAFQITASLLQPFVGMRTDRRPSPYSLTVGMAFSLTGVILLSFAPNFAMVLVAVALIGMGSSIFHPESSRVARMASGGRYGLAQSVFQVGGNAGSALGPLLVAFIVTPGGQSSVIWFSIVAIMGIVLLTHVGGWYKSRLIAASVQKQNQTQSDRVLLPPRKIAISIVILLALIFSKFFYMASISSYYTFYLIERFQVSVQQAQLYLFLFLASVAVGTVAGGPIGDRIGRKAVIWTSILGVLPFTLLLPHMTLFWTAVLSVIIGLILSSAFSAIMVYAQELLPGRVGTIAGLFFGFAFGMGGLGAALLGQLADAKGIIFVYDVCAFLPAIGLLAAFLPKLKKPL